MISLLFDDLIMHVPLVHFILMVHDLSPNIRHIALPDVIVQCV